MGRAVGDWVNKVGGYIWARWAEEGRVKGYWADERELGLCVCGGTGLITGGWVFGGLGSESRGPCKYTGPRKWRGGPRGGGGGAGEG